MVDHSLNMPIDLNYDMLVEYEKVHQYGDPFSSPNRDKGWARVQTLTIFDIIVSESN